jgi:protein phosphatase-4 regulatory subunit 3
VSLILINDGAVFEIILSDATIMKTIACLEYDPDLPADNPDRHRHRNFLARSSFRQVIPIRDPQLRGRIQQNFHIGYLKDAVLLRQLDDTTMASLNQTIYFNSMHIVTKLSEDADFLRDLFTTMLQLPTMSPDGGALGTHFSS